MDKKYTFEVELNGNKLSFNSRNDGFSAFELLGFISKKQLDINRQIDDEVKPDFVKREAVVD